MIASFILTAIPAFIAHNFEDGGPFANVRSTRGRIAIHFALKFSRGLRNPLNMSSVLSLSCPNASYTSATTTLFALALIGNKDYRAQIRPSISTSDDRALLEEYFEGAVGLAKLRVNPPHLTPLFRHTTPSYNMPEIYPGEVAYITGAASGIGKALALRLVGQGGRVVIADVNGEAGAKFATELNEKAGSVVSISVKADTTVWEEQLAGFQLAVETFKRIDYVFANAGVAERPWLPPFDPAAAASRPLTKPNLSTADINLTGQLYTAALALQTFERQEPSEQSGFRGKLIMTASVFGFFPTRAMPMYAASKAGIVHFMRSAAEYYADKNITVNAIAPNLIDTGIAPDVLFVPFREQNLLSDIQLVLDQFQKLLGNSTLNGQALSISQANVWAHPPDTYKLAENLPACDLISVEIFKLFGDKTK
ncbi:NAD(P)-binding protein [Mycena indigotica]|uniref:NAD(P)-binding protein n=1 Tax=Mycena indigotica TaxID=2126181 RepID=A0A8H6SEH0_9AGAR|nr:NAD(P)-binding protein [Mycena indigotica]KAF7297457.1 NAD(P)-binding protein [Mycena indigotica]